MAVSARCGECHSNRLSSGDTLRHRTPPVPSGRLRGSAPVSLGRGSPTFPAPSARRLNHVWKWRRAGDRMVSRKICVLLDLANFWQGVIELSCATRVSKAFTPVLIL